MGLTLLLFLNVLPALIIGHPYGPTWPSSGYDLNAARFVPASGMMAGSPLNNYGSLCSLEPEMKSMLSGQLNQQLGSWSNQPQQYNILGLAQSRDASNRYMCPIQLANGACQGLELGLNSGMGTGAGFTIYNTNQIDCGMIQPMSICSTPVILGILQIPVIVQQPVVVQTTVPPPVVDEITEAPAGRERPEVVTTETVPVVSSEEPGCSQNVQVTIVGPEAAQPTVIVKEVPVIHKVVEVVKEVVREVAPPPVAPVRIVQVPIAPPPVAPVQVAPIQIAPIQIAPIQIPPIQVQPIQIPPIQIPSIQIPPVQVAPVQQMQQSVQYIPVCIPSLMQVSTLKSQLNALIGQQSGYSSVYPNQYDIIGLSGSINNANGCMVTVQTNPQQCQGLEVGLNPAYGATSLSRTIPMQCPSKPTASCGFSF